MNGGYFNQQPYAGMPFPMPQPAAPARPAKPWPLGMVNRWMTIGAIAITLLAVLLAVLGTNIVSRPPSTAGMTLAYQSSLLQNSSGTLHWDENADCQFTSDGLLVSAPDANLATRCALEGSSFQDFTLRVRVVEADDMAVIGFLSGDRLAIFGTGHYLLYSTDPDTGVVIPLLPRTGLQAGSAALHPTSLGTSERANDITIEVQELTYSFYANGQLLATYSAPALENAGPILLGASGGQQALFSDIAIYVPA